MVGELGVGPDAEGPGPAGGVLQPQLPELHVLPPGGWTGSGRLSGRFGYTHRRNSSARGGSGNAPGVRRRAARRRTRIPPSPRPGGRDNARGGPWVRRWAGSGWSGGVPGSCKRDSPRRCGWPRRPGPPRPGNSSRRRARPPGQWHIRRFWSKCSYFMGTPS